MNDKPRRIPCSAALYSVMMTLFVLMLTLPAAEVIADGDGPAAKVVNPGTELWREARDANKGTTQVEGVDSGVLINDAGERWRQYRIQQLAPYGAIILGGMLGIFVLYYLIRGKIRIEAGCSGKVLRRYTTTEMVVHSTRRL